MNGVKSAVCVIVLVAVGGGIAWKHIHDDEIQRLRTAANVELKQSLGPNQPILVRHADEFGFRGDPTGNPVNTQDEFIDLATDKLSAKTGDLGPVAKERFEKELTELYSAEADLAGVWDYGLKLKIDADRDGIELSPTSPAVQEVVRASKRLQSASEGLDKETSMVASVRKRAFDIGYLGQPSADSLYSYQSDPILAEVASLARREGHAKLVKESEDDGFAFIHDGAPLPGKASSDNDCVTAVLRGQARGWKAIGAGTKKELSGSTETLKLYHELGIVRTATSITIKHNRPDFINATVAIVERYVHGPLTAGQKQKFEELLGNTYDNGSEVVEIMNSVVQAAKQKRKQTATECREMLERLTQLRRSLEADTTEMYQDEEQLRSSRPAAQVASNSSPGILETVGAWPGVIEYMWHVASVAGVFPWQ